MSLGASGIADLAISDAPTATTSSTITLTPNPVTSTWTLPSQTLGGSGSSTLTPGASLSTWTLPAQTISLAGTIVLPTAMNVWTLPAQTLTGSGTATISPDPVTTWVWTVPFGQISGGSGSGSHDAWIPMYWWNGVTMAIPSFNQAFAITPSDTVNFTTGIKDTFNSLPIYLTQSIYCGGAGVVEVVFPNDLVVAYTVTAGTTLFVSAKRVNNTSTTATLLIGQYQV